LLAELAGRHGRERTEEGVSGLPAPVAGDPRRLAAAFRRELGGSPGPARRRIRRLERWLARIARR
jgi:hypothetical protein